MEREETCMEVILNKSLSYNPNRSIVSSEKNDYDPIENYKKKHGSDHFKLFLKVCSL